MPRHTTISMQSRRLTTSFALGPLRFTNADSFPLDELYYLIEDHAITLRLSAHFSPPSPWQGISMAVFFAYRLPEGADEFQDDLVRYREDAQKSVTLPERQAFAETTLALGVSGKWDHQCFACSSRNLFHVYQSEGAAIMIRWFSQKGTMLDHPLLKLVRDNATLIAGQWETNELATHPVTATEPEASDDSACELGSEDRLELDLRGEYAAIIELLRSRIANFNAATNYGPGDGQTVSSVTLGFDFAQTGWVTVVFDTRQNAESDGSWTMYLGEDQLPRPHWARIAEALANGNQIAITMRDDSSRMLSKEYDSLGDILGTTLTEAISDSKKAGMFDTLPRSPSCVLAVEDILGAFGWAVGSDRPSGA